MWRSCRICNFWLDSFNFYRETDVAGWSFSALILFVEGGDAHPLGPFQGWSNQVIPQLFD